MSAEDYGYESYDARVVSELAALRASIAELEAQRDEFGPMFIRDLCEALGISDTSTLDVIMQSIRNMKAQPATANRDTLDKVWIHVLQLNLPLSYNNSGDECEILIGGDDMIGLQEAAELIKQAVTQPATLTPRQCNRLCFERGFEAGREAAAGAVRSLSHMPSAYEDAIRAMQPPAECGCNPLKPSESDAAMLDEWHKRM